MSDWLQCWELLSQLSQQTETDTLVSDWIVYGVVSLVGYCFSILP